MEEYIHGQANALARAYTLLETQCCFEVRTKTIIRRLRQVGLTDEMILVIKQHFRELSEQSNDYARKVKAFVSLLTKLLQRHRAAFLNAFSFDDGSLEAIINATGSIIKQRQAEWIITRLFQGPQHLRKKVAATLKAVGKDFVDEVKNKVEYRRTRALQQLYLRLIKDGLIKPTLRRSRFWKFDLDSILLWRVSKARKLRSSTEKILEEKPDSVDKPGKVRKIIRRNPTRSRKRVLFINREKKEPQMIWLISKLTQILSNANTSKQHKQLISEFLEDVENLG